MKFLTLIAGIVAIANLAYANNAYCPQTKDHCDKKEEPSKEIKGDLVEQIKDEIDCDGTVVVENACSFTVKDFVFKFNNHTNHEVHWWGSKAFNKGTGAGSKLSTEVVKEVEEKTNTSFTLIQDENCWTNLNTDIGTVYLMDTDNKVLCHAIIRTDLADASSGGSSGSDESGSTGGSTGGNGTSGGNGTTGGNGTAGGNNGSGATSTTAPAATTSNISKPTTTNKPNTDGASSKYLISSGALYLMMFALTLYLNH